jgi:hypothetical protein
MNRAARVFALLLAGLIVGCNENSGPVVSQTMPPPAPGEPQTAPPDSKPKPGQKALVRRNMGGGARQIGGE